MGALDSFRTKRNTAENKVDTDLSKDELDFLLQLIANSTFEGKDVQLVYQTALKIQNLIKNG
jgi:hypothetical protein